MLRSLRALFLNHSVTVSCSVASILGVRITKVFMLVVRSHRWPPSLTQTSEIGPPVGSSRNRRFQCVRSNGLVCL